MIHHQVKQRWSKNEVAGPAGHLGCLTLGGFPFLVNYLTWSRWLKFGWLELLVSIFGECAFFTLKVFLPVSTDWFWLGKGAELDSLETHSM